MKEISLLVLKVNAEEAEVVKMPQELKSYQSLVGGYIEMISIAPGIDMYLNEEGKLDGLESNFFVMVNGEIKDEIVGDVFFASSKGENTTSISMEQITTVTNKFMNRRLMILR